MRCKAPVQFWPEKIKFILLLYLLAAPILCNIYLHKLDLEVCLIQKKLKIYSCSFFCKESRKLIFSPKVKKFTLRRTKNFFEKAKSSQSCYYKINSTCVR